MTDILFLSLIFLLIVSVHPETNIGHILITNSEIGNFEQAQENQGIALKTYT